MNNNLKKKLLDYFKLYGWDGWWSILGIGGFYVVMNYDDIGGQAIIVLIAPIILLAPMIKLINKYTNISEGLCRGIVLSAIIIIIFFGFKLIL